MAEQLSEGEIIDWFTAAKYKLEFRRMFLKEPDCK
jgi:hypothetical protein